jgi:Sec-independent protein secretion pathway component TatC
MVPLLVLYELSILLASLLGRPARDLATEPASAEGS